MQKGRTESSDGPGGLRAGILHGWILVCRKEEVPELAAQQPPKSVFFPVSWKQSEVLVKGNSK